MEIGSKEWLQQRKNYIGASDCAGVLGLSQWSSPLKVWAEKTGLIEPEDLSKSFPVRFGIKAEQLVAEFFEEETGKKVQRVKETVYHKKYPFLACNIDRRVVGEDSLLECKTTDSSNAWKWEGEEIPQEYILQCLHQLMVTGKQKCYLAVPIGNREFKIKEIDRDEKVISQIEQKEVDFWNNYIVPKIQPTLIKANDTDTLAQLYPDALEGSVLTLTDEENKLLESLESFNKDKKSIDSQIEQIKNHFKALLGNNEIGKTSLYMITLKNVHKDAYEVKEQNYRVLRYKKIKGE